MAQPVKNPTSIHEEAGSIPGLSQRVKGSGIAGVPIVAQPVKNPTSIHDNVGSILGLIQWIRMASLQWTLQLWLESGGVVAVL